MPTKFNKHSLSTYCVAGTTCQVLEGIRKEQDRAVLFWPSVQFSSVHSVVSDSLRPHGLQHARLLCPSPAFRSLLKFMSIESVMPSNHIASIVPFSSCFHLSQNRVFSNESVLCIKWPDYWGFSFSISPSNE